MFALVTGASTGDDDDGASAGRTIGSAIDQSWLLDIDAELAG